MNKSFIPFALPDIGEEEINEVVDSLRSGWITTGPKVKRFEQEFSKYIGCDHSLAVNSATSGLHLALEAIGIKRGDKVITSPYTFTATAEVIRYFDAEVIFCDIDESTFNLDPASLEKVLKSSNGEIKAVIPVHIAGQSCEMEPILKLAREYNLKIIDDAAHALPTTSGGKLIGSVADITVFSFYATKTLATAEGGMICTNNADYAKRIKVMRLHGFNRDAWDRYSGDKASWYYEIIAPGFKYNMTDISAAMGIHQLAKIDQFHAKRKEIAEKYDQAFKRHDQIETPVIRNSSDKHAYHLYIIKIDKNIRNRFIDRMKEKGIGLSVHFIPLHIQPYWRDRYNLRPQDFPKAFQTFNKVVSLPIYTKMSDLEVERVIQSTIETLREIND